MFRSPNNADMHNLAKLSVLVVDDEPTLRLGFAYALSTKTIHVETAANGSQALERIVKSHFDIMILDLRMPELDGITVVERLRADGNQIPIVLCSAGISSKSALRALQLGVVDFLLKPVRPADLRQVVESVLRPERQPVPQALSAARKGNLNEAIKILKSDSASCRRRECWLEVLEKFVSDNADEPQLENFIQQNLACLAFNASPTP